MLMLINGKPFFYIGKINNIGYTNKEERTELLKQFEGKEVKEEKIELDKELVEKANKLAEKNLTYSKNEFLKLLKETDEIEVLQEQLAKSLQVNSTLTVGLMEMNGRLRKLENVKKD